MPTLRAATLSLLLVLAGAAPARAADGEGTRLDLGAESAKAASGSGSGSSLVRTIVGLAVVIGVIYGITWVLRQVKGAREANASGTGLETLATLPLGPSRSLHLVRAGDEVVLLGTGEGGLTAIRTYGMAEAHALGLLGDAEPALPAPAAPAPAGGLLAALRRRTVIR